MKAFAALLCVLIAGCVSAPAEQQAVGLANPASTYCAEQSGTLEIRKEAKGDTGYCHLPDGRIIEEWEFFRAKGTQT